MTTEETYNETEVQIVAIETNIRTLLKDHPRANQFIKELQNEAIDQAFRELSERITTLSCGIADRFSNTRKDIDVLFKDMDNGFLQLQDRISILEKHVEFLEKRTHHLAPKLRDSNE